MVKLGNLSPARHFPQPLNIYRKKLLKCSKSYVHDNYLFSVIDPASHSPLPLSFLIFYLNIMG